MKCNLVSGQGRATLVLAAVLIVNACEVVYAAAGQGAADVSVRRDGQVQPRSRVTVAFTARAANAASGGFLDLQIDSRPCPLLLDADNNIIAGRVCEFASGRWVISGGRSLGAALSLDGYQHNAPPGVAPTLVALTFPARNDAGTPGF